MNHCLICYKDFSERMYHNHPPEERKATITDALVESGMVKSRSQAKYLITHGAVSYINHICYNKGMGEPLICEVCGKRFKVKGGDK